MRFLWLRHCDFTAVSAEKLATSKLWLPIASDLQLRLRGSLSWNLGTAPPPQVLSTTLRCKPIYSLRSTRFSMIFHTHVAESSRNPSISSTQECAASADSVELSSSGPLRFLSLGLAAVAAADDDGAISAIFFASRLALLATKRSCSFALTNANVVFLHVFCDGWRDFCVVFGQTLYFTRLLLYTHPVYEHRHTHTHTGIPPAFFPWYGLPTSFEQMLHRFMIMG